MKGLSMHDLVRGYTLVCAANQPGGLRAMQRRVLEALGAALEASGSGANPDLLAYAMVHLAHHAAQARDAATPLLSDSLMHQLVTKHPSLEVRKAAAAPLSLLMLEREAAQCEAEERWLEAAELHLVRSLLQV